MAQKKVKRKFNKKALLVIFLSLYLIIMAFYYAYTLPIKNIYVNGNKLIEDSKIINVSKVYDYDKVFKINKKEIMDNLKEISEITDVKIKKSILGKVTIEVVEQDVLFYNALTNLYVLSDGSEVPTVTNNIGVPSLVNYVQTDIYKRLIDKMNETDKSVLKLVSEIEYTPNIKNGLALDPENFLLRMNDGNHVYINLPTFKNINVYPEMYATLEKKGVLYLDSVSDINFSFITFERLKELEEKGSGQDELPQWVIKNYW